MNNLNRTLKLLGDEKLKKLQSSHVLIVGIGGVGGCVFEMLLRCGVGHITVVDGDCFDETNLNRQILCTTQNVSLPKTQAALERAACINPNSKVTAMHMRYNALTQETIFEKSPNFIADCIDSVKDKTHLIVTAHQKGIPILSAMGAGNRIDSMFKVMMLNQTAGDGLAKALRKNLKEVAHKHKVVADTLLPLKVEGTPASISYTPNLMGCMMAQEIVKELLCQ